MLKVLNLYAGIGGNRKLWEDVEVTAIEYNQKVADAYQSLFPDDTVIVADAHTYLEKHYNEFDFIWSSPPCPTHSRFNLPMKVKRYPDMNLYQEIIFLKHFFKGKYCIENVTSYYEPLIRPYLYDGHYFWTNFYIKTNENRRMIAKMNKEQMALERGYDIDLLVELLQGEDVRLALRNCVLPSTGLYILNQARKSLEDAQKGVLKFA